MLNRSFRIVSNHCLLQSSRCFQWHHCLPCCLLSSSNVMYTAKHALTFYLHQKEAIASPIQSYFTWSPSIILALILLHPFFWLCCEVFKNMDTGHIHICLVSATKHCSWANIQQMLAMAYSCPLNTWFNQFRILEKILLALVSRIIIESKSCWNSQVIWGF